MKAQLIFSGMSDYWSGNGARWDDYKGCLFAYYGPYTTYEDIIQRWMADWSCGSSDFDGKELPYEPTDAEVEQALRSIFVPDIDWNRKIAETAYLEDMTEEEWEGCESPIYVCLLDLGTDNDVS